MQRPNNKPKTERDPDYLDAVRKLPCCAGPHGCEGRIEAHHCGRRGVGIKASDFDTLSLCQRHHRQLHDHTGIFKWRDRNELRAWLARMIERTRRMVEARK